MNDLGKQISQLASEFEQARDDGSEKWMVTRILQGALYALTDREFRANRSIIKVTAVEQQADSEGIYLNHFTVVTASGIRIRVTVEPE